MCEREETGRWMDSTAVFQPAGVCVCVCADGPVPDVPEGRGTNSWCPEWVVVHLVSILPMIDERAVFRDPPGSAEVHHDLLGPAGVQDRGCLLSTILSGD